MSLIPGAEKEEKILLLISLTSIKSEGIKTALIEYYVKGYCDSLVIGLNFISQSNFSRSLKTLNKVASTVNEIKDLDWARFKKENT
ncbi:hypothetical protein CJF42_22690 [Pseudoalteromonas sp. NBT06-2]|uniref:PapB/FocB family fimbrial expression transcriptional regulator n=1 Tax=Pseudoalteromonas sp. NBT06-2 TaxID=2025950 RepID=UPI000BA60188|nr:PapB/FocB family fimbrial expression transcriptional regulator [Pseudoalteromonas sp. NBT06-2]PAJ72163.1 hypothetical protein CJF42_22690 [Pseudoalteromonas sp. NBT06-2]